MPVRTSLVARAYPLGADSRRRRAMILRRKGFRLPAPRPVKREPPVEVAAPSAPSVVSKPVAPAVPLPKPQVLRPLVISESSRQRLRSLVKKISGLAWVFAGDSLRGPTDGSREWQNSAGRLSEYLQGRLHRTGDVVIDSTQYGSMLASLHEEIQERALRFKPDIVLICTGTNEAREGMKGLGLFEHQLARIVEEVLRAGAVPVLCTPPAVKEGATVDQLVYVEAIRAAAAEYDVPLVDHWDYWERMSSKADVLDRWCDGPSGEPGRHGHVELVHRIICDLELQPGDKVYG